MKRRVTCAFAKSFLNLINNFAVFNQAGKVSAYPAERERTLRKYSVSVKTKSCLFQAIYLSKKEDHSIRGRSLPIQFDASPNFFVKRSTDQFIDDVFLSSVKFAEGACC